MGETVIPQSKIEEFIRRLRDEAGSNLQSIILYGSAVTGGYDAQFSDLNLLCLLRDSSYTALEDIAPAIEWWTKQNERVPLILVKEELERSADVFAIELLDMQAQYRVLFGEDVLKELKVPTHLHRSQVEYELREKLILLRQKLLLAARDEARMRELLVRSLPSFSTLFRHTLIVMGENVSWNRRENVRLLATRLGFEQQVFDDLFDVREQRREPKSLNVRETASRYLAAVEHVTATVDKMLDSSQRT
jgi:predicted nucleotidyltransferase